MANWQVISLDTTTPQLRAPGTGDGYSFNSGSTQLGVWTTTGLGIGTASPAVPLDVVSNSGSNGINIRARVSNDYGFLNFKSNDGSDTAGSIAALRAGVNSGSLLFYTGTTERARLDTSGNLGLGVTPSAWSQGKAMELSAVGNGIWTVDNTNIGLTQNAYYVSGWKYARTAAATFYDMQNGIHRWWQAASGTAGNTISFTQAMTLDASGNLSLGVNGTSFQWTNSGNNVAMNAASGVLSFYTGTSAYNERARITSGGQFLVGKTTYSDTTVGAALAETGATNSTMAASDNATTTHNTYSTGAGAYRFYVGMGGTVYATNTTISAISDQRLKENVRDLDVGLDAVMALKPRKFDWKEGKGQDKKDVRGFIAQEFEQVFPDLIDEWKDPAPEGEEPYKSVRQDLIPVLVKAIQELKAELDATKAKVAALKGA